MSKQSELMDRLAMALPSQAEQATRRQRRSKKATTQLPITNEGASKRSISLYSADLQRLDAIKEFMAGQGVRNLSDSEALRLACRCVEPTETLIEVYQQMRAEDRRRK